MYNRAANYSVEFFTPPYNFLAAPGSRVQSVPRLLPSGGLAGACCSGCANKGVGLFDSFDPGSWGLGEYAVVGLGAYAALSMFLTTRSAVRSVSKVGKNLSYGKGRVKRAAQAFRDDIRRAQ